MHPAHMFATLPYCCLQCPVFALESNYVLVAAGYKFHTLIKRNLICLLVRIQSIYDNEEKRKRDTANNVCGHIIQSKKVSEVTNK